MLLCASAVTTECVGLTRRLGTEPHNLTGFDGVDRQLQGRHERHEILEAVTSCDKDDDRDPELLEILLKREVPIDRHKHVELVLGKGEQLAVFVAGPARLWDGTNLMPGE